MPTDTTYSYARANLAALCDHVTSTHRPVIIHRRGAKDVALVDADEPRGLIETAYLLRSLKNAQRLITGLIRARERELASATIETLRQEFNLGETS